MNIKFVSAKFTVFFLFYVLSSLWFISCGMRTEPVFIPEQISKRIITDLQAHQYDNRVRLSWKINQNERGKGLKNFDQEFWEGYYFLIHQKLIHLDCSDCVPKKLPDLKVLITNDSLIREGDQLFFYIHFPKENLKINSYQVSYYGPDGEFFSQSQSVRLRRSNYFPKIPALELEIVQIEDYSQILRFPFGKVVQQKKIEIVDRQEIEQFKETEKKDKSEEIFIKINPQIEFRLFTIRISWNRLLNQSLKGFFAKSNYFEGQEFYRNHLYRKLNKERWPENPLNKKSPLENYYLDILKMQIIPLNLPLSVDTHPDILPSRIPFYIDLSVKYVDTWHYKLRLVDRFGNESKASESISFDMPKTSIFAKDFGKKILVPHAY